MYRRLSEWAPIVALTMIVSGVAVGCLGARGAFIPHLTDYTLAKRGSGVGDVTSHLPAALRSDHWLIAAYGLVLAGCALFYWTRATSRVGRQIARFVSAAVLVAVLADVAEDGLLSLTLSRDTDVLRTATATAATVKFCAMAVAAFGLMASAGIVLRGAMGSCRAWTWRRRHGDGKDWWTEALIPRNKQAGPTTDEALQGLIDNQQSWLRAYDVPGVREAMKGRAKPFQALCLSGGGVRSACVAMGAMQVFSKPWSAGDVQKIPASYRTTKATLLDGLDYVISVSGGGYAAGARLLAVQPQHVDPKQKCKHKAPPRDEPLPSVAPISARYEEGSAEFDHMRRGSSYIADSPLDLVRALAEVLKNLLATLGTLFLVPVIAGWAVGWLLARFPIAAFPPVPAESTGQADSLLALADHPAAYWALGFFAAWAVVFTMVALFIEWKWASPSSERLRMRVSGLARVSAGFGLVVFALTIALPGLMRLCWWASNHALPSTGSALGALSGVVGLNYVAALIAILWRGVKKLPHDAGAQSSTSWLKRVLPPAVISLLLIVATLAVLLIVWLALLGSFAAGVFHSDTASGQLRNPSHFFLWVAGLLLVVLSIGFTDVTSLSLHPFYRRRLARTFAVRRIPGTGAPNEAVRYLANEPTWLHLYGHVSDGPKFVFACSATIAGPDKPAPGLNAVSYVMSADYVGGPELGWFATKELFDAAPPRIRRDLTVEAAVAVSGAAFASAMGRQDKGIEKLLAVSGARLGTWLPNPHFVSELSDAESGRNSPPDRLPWVWPKSLPTVRGSGYLYRELLGINNKDARLVQITDGGHYDNSGLVEAFRRRCGLIFVVDGGGDPPPLPLGLTDALRLAKYELGVDVTLKETGQYSVASIAPGSGTPFDDDHALASLNSRITRGAVVVGTITYPAAAELKVSTGILIFAKAVLSEACPYWLKTYAASSEIFPHDPTSDQWFSEGQFAAYTELGRVIADEAVQCLKHLQPDGAAEPRDGLRPRRVAHTRW